MKIIIGSMLLLLNIKGACQAECDSNLFRFLVNTSNQKQISISDFIKCEQVVDQLWDLNCSDFLKTINGDNYAIANLTYLFGKICVIADSEIAVKSYVNYMLKNKNSAEEQLSYSFENLFVKRPESVLLEIIKQDSSDLYDLLYQLAWGFVNNRAYGAVDPFSENQFKAMTVYHKPPKIILDSTNYRAVYFSLNPEITRIYNKHKLYIEFVLSQAYAMIEFDRQHREAHSPVF